MFLRIVRVFFRVFVAMQKHRIKLDLHGDIISKLMEDEGGLFFSAVSQIDTADFQQLIADLKADQSCQTVFADGADKLD